MITGFRWHLKGAQHFYGVKPDLSTFGKAMANGFSVAAICGKKKIMELGSITNKEERVFSFIDNSWCRNEWPLSFCRNY